MFDQYNLSTDKGSVLVRLGFPELSIHYMEFSLLDLEKNLGSSITTLHMATVQNGFLST